MPNLASLSLCSPLLAIAVAVCLLTLGAPEPAGAGPLTITVTLADDPGNGGGNSDCFSEGCTLTEAIELAEATPGRELIVFDPQNAPYGIIPPDPLEINATDGISIDGAGGAVEILGYEAVGPGLSFISDPGETLGDVYLANLTIDSFVGPALRFCPAPNGACGANVSNVTIENVTTSLNHEHGLFMEGIDISTVTLDNFDVPNHSGFGQAAVWIDGDGEVSDISVRNSTISNTYPHTALRIRGGDDGASDIEIVNNTATDVGAFLSVGSGGTTSGVDVIGNTAENVKGTAVSVTGDQVLSPIVRNNTLTVPATVYDTVFLQSDTTGALVESNTITGGRTGIWLHGETDNIVRSNVVSGASEDGITMSGEVLITRNSFFGNGELGIDLPSDEDPPGVTLNDPGDGDEYHGNPLLNFPVITFAGGEQAGGTACNFCTVELFIADDDPSGYGEGKTFLGSSVVAGGNWVIPVCGLGLQAGDKVTTTASLDGNTSEFSLNYEVVLPSADCPSPTPGPTETPGPTGSATPAASVTPTTAPSGTPGPVEGIQGDLDCDGEVTVLDALLLLLFLEDLPFGQGDPCPGLTDVAGGFQFADVNCDGVIDEDDVVAIIAHMAGAPIEADGCPPVGEPL